jgi:hypothetical protein
MKQIFSGMSLITLFSITMSAVLFYSVTVPGATASSSPAFGSRSKNCHAQCEDSWIYVLPSEEGESGDNDLMIEMGLHATWKDCVSTAPQLCTLSGCEGILLTGVGSHDGHSARIDCK